MTTDRPLRVLHLVRSMRVGGLEKVVLDLTRGLCDRGVQSFLGCLFDSGEWASQARVEACWEGNLGRRGPAGTLRALCRFVRTHGVDIIHTHNSHPHKYGVPASILIRVPLVHTKHGRNWPDNSRWVWFSRQLSRFTRVVVPVSRDIERIVTDVERVPRRKVTLILNGVDTEAFCPAGTAARAAQRRRLGLPTDAFVMGSVGRLSPEKQYPWLVALFAEFLRGNPGSTLVLVGDGPHRPEIEQAIEEHGVRDRVRLTGVREDVADWLHCLDLFVLSSDQEGTCITLLEAGATGVPAVVTDVGGNSDIVQDGRTGRVVPFGDTGAFVSALAELAGDAPRRTAMGRAAREHIVSGFSLDAMADAYVEVYRAALARRRSHEVDGRGR